MTQHQASLLVVDDNDDNRDLLTRRLERKGYSVTTSNNGRLALELIRSRPFDLILLDLMMPDMSGLEVLDRLRVMYTAAELPVIMVTARSESGSVVEALEMGANDYVTKPVDFPVLFARITPQLERKRAERELMEANAALEARVADRTSELESVNEWLVREIGTRQQAETQMRLLLESSAEGIFGTDQQGVWTFCNPSCAWLLGYKDPGELIGQNMLDKVFPVRPDGEGLDKGNELILHAIQEGKSAHADRVKVRRADGRSVMAECWTRPMLQDDEPIGAVISLVDITERMLVEERLNQSHKLEAVGQLAGGIAHEFNNLLMIVSGYIQKAADNTDDPARVAEYLGEAREATNRAGKLTKQLLVFSRKRMFEKQRVDVNDLLGTVDSLLRPLIDEHTELQFEPAEEDACAEIDYDQLVQALVNLVINARDAQPDGGRVRIGCYLTGPDTDHPSSPGVGSLPEPYVAVFVEDNGTGMDEETRRRIFEPFFTTKGPDTGTGLGLAMVYGFVEQSSGFVDVQSTPGEGSRFTLYFPRVQARPEILSAADESAPRGNGEVILVVEDEEPLRRMICDDLEALGYKVLSACDGPDAIEVEEEYDGPIDLMLSDMVMPGFNGAQVARALRETQENLKVILMSGYPTTGQSAQALVPEGIPFLSKPVDRPDLAKKIREILDQTGVEEERLPPHVSETAGQGESYEKVP